MLWLFCQFNRGKRACQTCSAGHFYVDPKNMTGQANCIRCPPGYYNRWHSFHLHQTIKSHHFDACREKFGHRTKKCEVTFPFNTCPNCMLEHWFPHAATYLSFQICEPGTFSTFAGSTKCEDCQKGRFGSFPAQSACKLCAPGRLAGGSLLHAARIWNLPLYAPLGRFSSNHKASTCHACPSQRIASKPGQSSCQVPKYHNNVSCLMRSELIYVPIPYVITHLWCCWCCCMLVVVMWAR